MDSVSGVGVIDKAALVLRAVRARPLDLAELQAATGLPRATAHRLVVALGRAAAEQFGLGEVAMPAMQALLQASGESVQLYVREDEARRCVVSLQSPHALRWIVPEGSLLPLGVGSAGRVLGGEPVGPGGWIDSVEQREPGVASVSAPVLDRAGRVIAAISVSGPVERLSREPGARHGAAVAAAGVQIGDAVRAALH